MASGHGSLDAAWLWHRAPRDAWPFPLILGKGTATACVAPICTEILWTVEPATPRAPDSNKHLPVPGRFPVSCSAGHLTPCSACVSESSPLTSQTVSSHPRVWAASTFILSRLAKPYKLVTKLPRTSGPGREERLLPSLPFWPPESPGPKAQFLPTSCLLQGLLVLSTSGTAPMPCSCN